jgi:serine/threonine protein kinase
MNAEIRFHTRSGQPFKCVGVYKTEKRKTSFLEPDVAAEVACYARLMKKPCLSKGIFIKLATSDNKSVMENYISDLDHIFWSGERPSTLVPTDADLLNEMVKAISFQMLTGLKGMHDEHIRHRDIKPANTFIAYDGEIVLGDFGGCFHAALGFKKLNGFYGKRGTPTYTAPEARIPRYGPKCDLWSIGACIYEFITRSYLIGTEFSLRNPNDAYIRYVNSKLERLHVNPDAKSLIVALLNSDQSARPTAERCLSHPWFAGLTLARAQDIVVESLKGQCMVKANKKIANTLTRTNRGVIRNDQSDAFMRIHEGVGWVPQSSDVRDNAVKGLFNTYVLNQGYRLIKFLHAVELFDRLIQVDRSILDDSPKYILSCATLAELLSSEGYLREGWEPVFTSKKAAVTLTSLTHRPVNVSTVEQTMRNAIRLLGGDIFMVPDGIATKFASTAPRNADDFLFLVKEVIGLELDVDPKILDASFKSFSEKYL